MWYFSCLGLGKCNKQFEVELRLTALLTNCIGDNGGNTRVANKKSTLYSKLLM